MTFEQWVEEYFGKDVSYPDACRDAWNAATLSERRLHKIIPSVVSSEETAKELSKQDMFGRKWEIGDEFYVSESNPSAIYRFFK